MKKAVCNNTNSGEIFFIKTTAYVGKCAVGFAKSVWNPSFSSKDEALYVRGIAKHSFTPNEKIIKR